MKHGPSQHSTTVPATRRRPPQRLEPLTTRRPPQCLTLSGGSSGNKTPISSTNCGGSAGDQTLAASTSTGGRQRNANCTNAQRRQLRAAMPEATESMCSIPLNDANEEKLPPHQPGEQLEQARKAHIPSPCFGIGRVVLTHVILCPTRWLLYCRLRERSCDCEPICRPLPHDG